MSKFWPTIEITIETDGRASQSKHDFRQKFHFFTNISMSNQNSDLLATISIVDQNCPEFIVKYTQTFSESVFVNLIQLDSFSAILFGRSTSIR